MKRFFSILLAAFAVISVQARPVTGKVHCGRTALSGVIVTDGVSFVKTDASGCFTIDIADDARFVSIVSPSGYTPDYSGGVPQFFVRVTPKLQECDFKLKRSRHEGKDYNLVVISDPQIKTAAHYRKLKKDILSDVVDKTKACERQANTATVILGDLGWDSWPARMPQKYPKMFRKMGGPVYPVIGNHDFNRNKVDVESWEDYEGVFGPVNWAFYIGDALVVGLKDIDYNTNKKYKNGYTDEEVRFVEGLMKVVPPYTKLYVAQHCPIYRWFDRNPYIIKADKVIAAMQGRDVTFLSGHTHMASVDRFNETMVDCNPSALSSSIWYFDKWNNDGTPRGYFIFSSREGKVRRDFHAIDLPDGQKVEFFHLGQSLRHPNSIVVNAWNADENWKFEWFEDGKYMGRMQQTLDVSASAVKEWKSLYPDFDPSTKSNGKKLRYAKHYFLATPSQYAKTVRVVVTDAQGSKTEKRFSMSDYCDVQAHRGGAGRKPEDTIPAMKYGLDVGVNTLELDVWLSKDKLPVVSHDSWFHTRLATRPDGTTVGPDDPKEYLYTMPYDSIAKYDVGMKLSDKFPVHDQVACAKPLLGDLIDFCESYARENGLDLPRYNIEIKYKHGKGEGTLWPEITENINITLPLLLSKNLGDRLVVQCFDPEGLNYMHEHYPGLKLSFLTDEKKPDYAANKADLNFVPDWISPHYSCVTPEMVKTCHADGSKIVPWTVDEYEDIKRMIEYGCDAVISNYPDRMLELTRGYVTYVVGNENEINIWPRN